VALPRSKRTHEYGREEAADMRKKVYRILSALLIFYLIYLFAFSSTFRITNLNLSGSAGETQNGDIEKTIWQALERRRFIIFPGNNYFFADLKNIQQQAEQANILAELSLTKKFPHTLNVGLVTRLGKLVWVAGEQFYILELGGKITSQLMIKELVNVKMPVVYDLGNTPVVLGQETVNSRLVALIADLYTNFGKYDLPAMDLDYFKVDGPGANYVKIVTKQGFEIHVNYLNSLENQFAKLKKSLLAGKIDLTKVNYINLRVENQVIYK
jgi:cell division septal protein FtsQ